MKTPVVEVTIEEHENADRLEIAHIEGTDFVSCVPKGKFETEDKVAYIQPSSIVPDEVLEELGLKGELAGSEGRRVKPVKLRGVLSQGICFPARDGWEVGDDVSEELGIEKYEPPIPPNMNGEVYPAGRERTISYDIENFRHYPDLFESGDRVVVTEKVHGTFCMAAVLSEEMAHDEFGRLCVSSKGRAKKGLAFQPFADQNDDNIYLRAVKDLGLLEKLSGAERSIYVLGEVFGEGVQDLHYGADASEEGGVGFRAFDVAIGNPERMGYYLNDYQLEAFLDAFGIPRVPVLYRGSYNQERIENLAYGPEKITGDNEHIREGVIVRPIVQRGHPKLGRVQLKYKSDDYLTRHDGTERH